MSRKSIVKSVFLNPLVWIAWVLTGFSLSYEGDIKAFELFYKPTTYRNLFIGTAIYVLAFDRQYKYGRSKLDVKATIYKIITTGYTILFVWIITLGLIANYRVGGRNYSAALTEKYKENGIGRYGNPNYSPDNPNTATQLNMKDLEGAELERGKTYTVTPQADGSYKIEVD